jgi:hypothetical protein
VGEVPPRLRGGRTQLGRFPEGSLSAAVVVQLGSRDPLAQECVHVVSIEGTGALEGLQRGTVVTAEVLRSARACRHSTDATANGRTERGSSDTTT